MLKDRDFVMVERAPSLSKFNNQPFRLAYWDIECMGMHPKVFSYFHGDYDGDECHMYAIGNPNSIEESLMWRPPLDRKLCNAEEYMEKEFPGTCSTESRGGGLEFMEYNTLSFREIFEGRFELPMGNWVRNKKDHLRMFGERIEDKNETKGFLQDTIKGVKDIVR